MLCAEPRRTHHEARNTRTKTLKRVIYDAFTKSRLADHDEAAPMDNHKEENHEMLIYSRVNGINSKVPSKQEWKNC